MNNSAIAGIAFTLTIHLSLVGGVAAFTDWGGGRDEPDEKKFFAIEASLAYQSTKSDQPQKATRKARKNKVKPPDPVPTPRPPDPDAEKPPDEPKEPDEPQQEEDFSDDFQRYFDQRQADAQDESELDEDLEEGAEDVAPAGQFDGSKHGFAEVSRGDPYMQKLAAEVYQEWELATLERGAGDAVGCLRLAADGSVVSTELWKSTENANIDRSVENALTAVMKKRKPGESPVPRHLMDATTQWTCFKFSVDGK